MTTRSFSYSKWVRRELIKIIGCSPEIEQLKDLGPAIDVLIWEVSSRKSKYRTRESLLAAADRAKELDTAVFLIRRYASLGEDRMTTIKNPLVPWESSNAEFDCLIVWCPVVEGGLSVLRS